MLDIVTDSDILEDIKLVASRLKCSSLSRSEYLQHGRFNMYQLYDGGRTWGKLCAAAGVKSKTNEPVPDDVYFERLKEAIMSLGRYPKTTERKQYSLNFSKRRYPTLKAFIERAVDLGMIEPQEESVLEPPTIEYQPSIPAVAEPDTMTKQTEISAPAPPIPRMTKRSKWQRIDIEGFPYAPQDEIGVVALFAILCSQGHTGWQILELNSGKGIDAICYDFKTHKEIRVELKYTLSRAAWNHPIEDIDYVVCWKNRWLDFPKPVIELCSLVLGSK